MDELIKAMSDKDLAELKTKYADNPSVATLIDGILESRAKEAEAVKVKTQFTNGIEKLFAKLPHPEDVHNVYARWTEVDVPIEGGEPEEVTITVDGEEVTESRLPMTKAFQWVVETNKGFTVKAGSGDGTVSASKRAIIVSKRSDADASRLELVGKFASASKACEYLKLTIGGDSATRVITREGYFIEPYEGTDYTS